MIYCIYFEKTQKRRRGHLSVLGTLAIDSWQVQGVQGAGDANTGWFLIGIRGL